MQSERWRPLFARGNADGIEAHDVLVEGVPGWLVQPLIDWLNKNFLLEADDGETPSRAAMQALQVNLRVRGIDWESVFHAHESILSILKKDERLFLSAVDYVLHCNAASSSASIRPNFLECVLEAGGSAWAVAPDRRGLVRRTLPEASESVRVLSESGGNAGRHLALAWRYAFGLNPDPSAAYREAVRAVEAKVCPVVLPRDRLPTLGKVIRALKDAPHKVSTVYEDEPCRESAAVVLRQMMELVWTNQLDRHGTGEEGVPLHVSQEQAEAALHIAVALVQLFERGFARARE